jgi:hypothetical protein
MKSTGMTGEIAQSLRSDLRGKVITPEDASYDEARQLYNAMIDKHPKIIARCVDRPT